MVNSFLASIFLASSSVLKLLWRVRTLLETPALMNVALVDATGVTRVIVGHARRSTICKWAVAISSSYHGKLKYREKRTVGVSPWGFCHRDAWRGLGWYTGETEDWESEIWGKSEKKISMNSCVVLCWVGLKKVRGLWLYYYHHCLDWKHL